MPRGDKTSQFMIGEHGVRFDIWQVPVDHHDWHTPMEQEVKRIGLVTRGDKDDSIDLFLAKNIDIEQLTLGIQLGVTQKNAVSFSERFIFDAAADLGKEGIGAIRED
jgi:hypothetical protein